MQGSAVEEFEDEVIVTALSHRFVSLHDIGVIQSHGYPRLVGKHVDELLVVHHPSAKLLDDNQFACRKRSGLVRKKDICHPPASQLLHNFITSKPHRGTFR